VTFSLSTLGCLISKLIMSKIKLLIYVLHHWLHSVTHLNQWQICPFRNRSFNFSPSLIPPQKSYKFYFDTMEYYTAIKRSHKYTQ
jgi:hypothetical protein